MTTFALLNVCIQVRSQWGMQGKQIRLQDNWHHWAASHTYENPHIKLQFPSVLLLRVEKLITQQHMTQQAFDKLKVAW